MKRGLNTDQDPELQLGTDREWLRDHGEAHADGNREIERTNRNWVLIRLEFKNVIRISFESFLTRSLGLDNVAGNGEGGQVRRVAKGPFQGTTKHTKHTKTEQRQWGSSPPSRATGSWGRASKFARDGMRFLGPITQGHAGQPARGAKDRPRSVEHSRSKNAEIVRENSNVWPALSASACVHHIVLE
jgi:hypothetical protein